MKKLISLATVLFSVFALTAQTNEVRIEHEDGASFSGIYTIADAGFVYRTIKKTDETETMFYSYYDEDMTLVQKEQFTLPVKIRWEIKCEDEEYMHTIYKTPKSQIVVRTASKITFEFHDITVTQPKKSRLLGVKSKGDYLWFKLRADGGKIWRVNWRTGEGSFFPVALEGVKEKNMVISEVFPTSTDEIYVIIQKEVKKSFHEYALRISAQGEVLETHLISKSKLVNTKMLEIEDGSFLFVGTYSTLSKHPIMKGTQSEGLKIIAINDSEITSNQDLSYHEIPRFLEYSQLGEVAEQHRILSFDVVPTSHGHIIVGEAYYRQRKARYYDATNNEYTDFYYENTATHGFICTLDNNSEIDWTTTFKNHYSLSEYLYQKPYFTIFKTDEDSYTLVNYQNNANFEINVEHETVTEIMDQEELIDSNYNKTYWFGDEKNDEGDVTATYIIKREKR